MKMLRIGYYTEVNLNKNDGPAVNELEFIKSLSSLNVKNCSIFLASENKNNPVLEKLNVFFLGDAPRISMILKWFRRFLLINKEIKNRKTQILVCRLTDYPIVPLLVKIFNPKIKLSIKTAALWWVGRSDSKKVSDRIYLFFNDLITKAVYRRADAIDVAMPETKKTLIALGLAQFEKTKIIDNNINTEMFFPDFTLRPRQKINVPKNSIVLGFAGSLPTQRGATQILKVAEKLESTINNLYVLIVGYDERLHNLVEQTSFPRKKILLTGQLPYSEIPTCIAAMTICYSFFEEHKIKRTGNASQKVKQYISMGKPVISVSTGHEYLQKQQLGSPVNQNDIEEIARETVKWIKRIETEGDMLAQRLHQYAVDHLSTEKTLQQRLEFWNSILKKG